MLEQKLRGDPDSAPLQPQDAHLQLREAYSELTGGFTNGATGSLRHERSSRHPAHLRHSSSLPVRKLTGLSAADPGVNCGDCPRPFWV